MLDKQEVASQFPKRCNSCGSLYSEEGWKALTLVGHTEDADMGRLELRNCAGCRSTLAVETPRIRFDWSPKHTGYILTMIEAAPTVRDFQEWSGILYRRLRVYLAWLDRNGLPGTMTDWRSHMARVRR